MAKKILFFEAIATLVGCIIGAGILAMPYIFAQSGYFIGLIHLLVLGGVVLFLNLAVGEICLRTKGIHEFTGYAEKYFGRGGKIICVLIMTIGIAGALVAYIIGIGDIFASMFNLSPTFFSLIFFGISAAIIYFDLKVVEESEFLFSLLMLVIVIVLSGFLLFDLKTANLFTFNFSKAFLPYGVVLFALMGSAAIPEMAAELQYQKKKLRLAIIFGTLIPIAVYFLFTLAVVGRFTTIPQIATLGLMQISRTAFIFGNVFAILAMATTFFALGLALKWMFHYDFQIKKWKSWLITCLIPLLLWLAGAKNFISAIILTGAIAGSAQFVLITIMAMKAKKLGERKPEYEVRFTWPLAWILIILFILGIISTFLK